MVKNDVDQIQELDTKYKKKPYNFSVVPYQIDQHLEFIDISEDGYLLLGSSNLVLSGNSSIWYFQHASQAPEKKYILTGHGCDYPAGCGKFLENSEQIIVGDDFGAVTVYFVNSLDNNSVHIFPHKTSFNHDGSITSLTLSSSKKQSVSSGTDLAINVWDNEYLTNEHKYMPAHTRIITCVAASKEQSSTIFASCSMDGTALLWDPRLSKPASCIKPSQNCCLMALSWKNDTEIAIGSQSGHLDIIDVRTKNKIFSESVLDCSVHNLNFNSDGLLAICGDSTCVKVWDSKSTSIIYTDERHTEFARGLAWHPLDGKLYSCGFDKQVFSHEVAAESL